MAYTPQEWRDGDPETPLSAERLNHIERGIADVETTPGPPGADGTDGQDGAPGADGADGQDGADGFPTEEQWNDLVARVEALETAGE